MWDKFKTILAEAIGIGGFGVVVIAALGVELHLWTQAEAIGLGTSILGIVGNIIVNLMGPAVLPMGGWGVLTLSRDRVRGWELIGVAGFFLAVYLGYQGGAWPWFQDHGAAAWHAIIHGR